MRGQDKAKRRMNPRSLANLKSYPAAPQGNLRALHHGASSERLIGPLTDRYLAELLVEFPGASERVLKVQARRLAKLDRLGSWLESKGELRNRQSGTVYAASQLEEQIANGFLATQEKLERQQREARDTPERVLARIVGELEEGS